MPNTKSAIPDGELYDIRAETELDVPDLPGAWEWRDANHYANFNGKANLFFGLRGDEPGGWFGEIDNYVRDGSEWWTVHVRPIVDDGTENGTPREDPETTAEYESLAAAIEAVPSHIATNYGHE